MSTATTTAKREGETQELPVGWRWIKLGDISCLINGDAYRDSDWSQAGTRIIRIQNLNDVSKPFNHWAGPLQYRVHVKSGDVLLAWSGTPGTSFGAHLWDRGEAVLNQHIFRVDIDLSVIISEWAVIAINHQLDALIGKAHGGVGLRHVTKEQVSSLPIAVPPIREQHRIMTVFREQMAAVERANAAAQARFEAIKALPAAYLRQVFSPLELSLPEGWRWVELGNVASLLPSKSIATYGEAEVEAITTACLTELGFNLFGTKSAKMKTRDIESCMVNKGEVLVARSNTPELVGRAALFDGAPYSIVASDLTIRVQANRSLLPDFLARFLSYLFVIGYWKNHAGGASGTMKKITRTQVLNLKVPLPSFSEQQSIALGLYKKMSEAKQARAAADAELNAINALPAALLRRAFNGVM